MLFVMIMAIYAYRIYSNKKVLKENKLEKKDIKNWAIFGTFSLISAYTHYYGLMAAGITNIILFMSFFSSLFSFKTFLFEYILYAYIAIIITNSIAHPYIRISLAYTIFAGSVYVNSENIAPAFSPKSFLICVYQ